MSKAAKTAQKHVSMTAVEKKPRDNPWEVTVPAGRYFLGDPCYGVPDEDWHDLLETNGCFGADKDGSMFGGTPGPVGTVHGYDVLGFGTAYGDGVYRDQYGHEFGVDAGMIGLVPEGLCKRLPEPDFNRLDGDLGMWIEFDEPTECRTDGNGDLWFGGRHIDTAEEWN